jgi:hypothetical protein
MIMFDTCLGRTYVCRKCRTNPVVCPLPRLPAIPQNTETIFSAYELYSAADDEKIPQIGDALSLSNRQVTVEFDEVSSKNMPTCLDITYFLWPGSCQEIQGNLLQEY